jgi:hypothetical protein
VSALVVGAMNRLERRPAQMQATDQRMQAGNAGQPHRVQHDVHCAAVTTPRQHDKPLAPNMDDEQRGLPPLDDLKPSLSRARLLSVGIWNGSTPGTASRRRLQMSG